MHTRIFCVVSGSQLLFCFCQVERATVGFRVSGNQVDDESHDGRNVSFENVPSVGLTFYDGLNIHGTTHHDYGQYAEADRKLVADNHGSTSYGTNQCIFTVTTPSGQQNTQYTDGRSCQHKEDTDVHVKDFSTFIPWKTRECQNGSKNYQERRQSIKKMVGMLQADDFLGKDFQYVGRYLQQTSFSSYTVRTDTALESRTDFTFHVDKNDGQYCVHDEDKYSHNESFQCQCQPFRHYTA